MSEQEQQACLACTAGSSDKVYFAQLIKDGGGWRVTAQSGARGGSLKCRDKHTIPVPYVVAEKAFKSLVKSKLASGYVPSDALGGTQMTDAPIVPTRTDINPQLLNVIDVIDVEHYLRDPEYIAQPKHDGERRPFVIDGGDVYGVNKKGMRVALPIVIANHAAELGAGCEGRTILDGEQIGDTLYVWDVMEIKGCCLRSRPLLYRLERLAALLAVLPADCSIVLTETAVGYKAKRDLLDRITAERREGIVFKRDRSPYTSGRPASGGDWLKHPLRASATVRVKMQNPGKASIAVEMKDGDSWVFVGNVTIPPNHSVPAPGTFAEITYLYVAKQGGCLYQPVLKMLRSDSDESDCGIGQLKYKGLAQAA